MLQQSDVGHRLMGIEEENEKQGAEIFFSSESEVKVSDSGHQSTDTFKQSQFIICPRRGKFVGKVRSIDGTIYLLTAIGLPPGGSSTVRIYM